MKIVGVGEKLPEFKVAGVKGGFTQHEEAGHSAFMEVSTESFNGRWQVLFFWPKNFTFVCPTEIVEFGKLKNEFKDRDCDLYGASTDNEFSHLAWRREHKDLHDSPFIWLADPAGKLTDQLGIRDPEGDVAQRATFLVDPHNVIQHVTVNALGVGRNPTETLRILDALQTDELCPCNRAVGGETIKA